MPPDALATTRPFKSAKQAKALPLVVALKAAAGCEMVTVCAVWFPLASNMEQVYVPAVNPVAMLVVCTGVVFQT